MNLHLPQSVEAATELREIAAVPKQLISPRLSKPLVSIVQDTLVGVNRLTRPTEFFSRREFMNLLVHSKRWDGRIPPPARPVSPGNPVPLWSGQQVVSALLPAIYLAMGNKVWDEAKGKGDPNYVVINNGTISQGILDGDIFDKALIHILYNDFSPEMTVDFIDSLQAVVATYLQNSGFSVGLSDLIADSETLDTIAGDMNTLKKQIESLQLQVHMGLFDNASGRTNQEEFESKVFQTLDKVIGAAGKTGLKSLAVNNRMVNMVKCGSKGADLNIAQMIALLGQQSIEGKRIAYGFQDRTLPHFKRYDDGAEARGFIESSFVKGLSPAEFFFHAMTGREGLIDTAVKSVTGDTEIRIVEKGVVKFVRIGDWIDGHLATHAGSVEHFPAEANLELLQLRDSTWIQTCDSKGSISATTVTAVTRHDPGDTLYSITTAAGRFVIVTAAKALIVYNAETDTYDEKPTADVVVGDILPAIGTLSDSTVQQDPIVSITPIDVRPGTPGFTLYPKMYDITVPSTLNFALANGLVVRDTADSGYMQRQLVKTMEDLMTCHDGTVRDAGGLVVQFAYGDDGTSATKIENQPIGLAKMSDTEIRTKFSVEDVAADKSQTHLAQIFADRDMLVNNVWNGKAEKTVQSAVHLPRLIANAVVQLGLKQGTGTPVSGAHVLDAITMILTRTRPENRLWGALLRFHLNPKDLVALGFTQPAFDWLAEQIVVKHMKSWVAPGEMAGIIAAQSLGEPSTQMTLNSVDWDTEILIAKDGKIVAPRIGEFIDNYIAGCDERRIQRLPNDQLYVALDDGHDWKAVSCDEKGQMMWTKLEAITKHPVVNEDGTDTILEVTTESGRTVKATKGRSFLKLAASNIFLPSYGSDLEIGDLLPIANSLAIHEMEQVTELDLTPILPPTEWLHGTEVAKALAAIKAADATGNRHWFSNANGKDFLVPYTRSDAFRDAFANGKNMHAANIKEGFVYPKKLWTKLTQIPAKIPLTREFGFFCGAYIAEGSTSPTQIQITNNDDAFLAPIRALMDTWEIGHHTINVDKVIQNTGIKGHTQSLVIHSTLLTKVMKETFGKISYEKTLPDWVLQAPDAFVKGLVDGYISGDGHVAKDGYIVLSSVSEALITRFASLLSRYGIFGTFSSMMPQLKQFKSVSRQYMFSILNAYVRIFAKIFTLTIQHKQERLTELGEKTGRACKWDHVRDMMCDKVVSIKECVPKGGKVYDLTVEKTRNFLSLNGLALVDTFHLAGVAAKSGMTRGVPRLKELLKATQNPKATSLTIYLRPDLRKSKEEARRLAQELEFTMLRDLVTVSRIYYDPRDSATLVADDTEWLSFFAAFEQSAPEDTSPWIIRLELDREKMFNKNITMEDVSFVLKRAMPIQLAYTDHNATQMIFRIRLTKQEGGPTSLDDLAVVKQMQNKLLTQTLVRGLPGLRSVTFRKTSDEFYVKNPANDNKYEPDDQFVLDTFGTNFLDTMIHPDVDGLRLVSNHVHDIYENLGIEAARAILFREIFGLFEQAAPVNYRHVAILCDAMCNRGRLMSADRYGVNKKKTGPLAKASFEQTEDIMLRAALFGEMDPVTGVSANIMTGQPIRGGTSFTQVLLDEAALIDFMVDAPARKVAAAPVLGSLHPQEEQEKEKPGCRQEDLRIPAALPPVDPMIKAGASLPDLEITLVDE